MKIQMLPKAKWKLEQYITNCEHEISGVGSVIVVNGEPLVTDVFLMEQTGASTETDLTADGQQALIEALLGTNHPMEHMRLWWHSHAKMRTFMSGTDVNTIDLLGPTMQGGWLLSICGNHKGEWFTRLDQFTFPRCTFEKLEVVEFKGELEGYEIADVDAARLNTEIEVLFAEIDALQNSIKPQVDVLMKEVDVLEKSRTQPILDEIEAKVKKKTYTYIPTVYQANRRYDYRNGPQHGIQQNLVNVSDADYKNWYKCLSIQCSNKNSIWTLLGGKDEEDKCPECYMPTKPHESKLIKPQSPERSEKIWTRMNFYQCPTDGTMWNDLATTEKERDPCPKCKVWTQPYISEPRADLGDGLSDNIAKELGKKDTRKNKNKTSKFSLLKGGFRRTPEA